MAAQADLPDSWCCPITGEVFSDPVITPNGVTFERTAIETWIKANHTCPVTRAPLELGQLIPNRGLRDIIDEKRAALAAAGTPLPAPTRTPAAAPTADVDMTSDAVGGKMEESPEQLPISASAPSTATSNGISVAMNAINAGTNSTVHVQVSPSAGTARTPVDVVCVVDTSGSMCSQAKATGVEDAGLSLLDIVKHAVTTVIHLMEEHDSLAIVSYSSTAKTVLELTGMNAAGKAQACAAVKQLFASGQTNLWDGLQQGLSLLDGRRSSSRLAAVMLLTDGCPTVIPPRGHLPMLRRFKDAHSKLNATIHTFGFGYSLDSKLLDEIAQEGNGMYCFIPDAGFVGTAFVHATANLLTTATTNSTLSIEAMNGATIVKEEDPSVTYTSWGLTKQLGSLAFGQSKDYVVQLKLPSTDATGPFIAATFKGAQLSGEEVSCSTEVITGSNGKLVAEHSFRQTFVALTYSAMELFKSGDKRAAQALVQDFLGRVSRITDRTANLDALVKDVKGQVTEALSKSDYFDKWGVHYLPSLRRAHALQQCNNFKDPGVQVYGGALFTRLRDLGDALFVKLPPPEPSRAQPVRRTSYASYSSGGRGGYGARGGGRGGSRRYSTLRSSTVSTSRARSAARPAPSMRSYHNASAGCIAGNSVADLADGSTKLVSEVRAGDILATLDGKGAAVTCVMRTSFPSQSTKLCRLSEGLALTPYHPVQLEEGSNGLKWGFPIDYAPLLTEKCPAVYNWVLESGKTHALVDGIPCITLGHGITGDEVAEHAYFGTDKVLADLRAMEGWESGMVELVQGCTQRDPETGLICGMTQHNKTA